MRWHRLTAILKRSAPAVSIPKRVSDALAQVAGITKPLWVGVSIPKRVSDALAPVRNPAIISSTRFQSLRGFPMRWHSFVYCDRAAAS